MFAAVLDRKAAKFSIGFEGETYSISVLRIAIKDLNATRRNS
jgi:hypothetical protein